MYEMLRNRSEQELVREMLGRLREMTKRSQAGGETNHLVLIVLSTTDPSLCACLRAHTHTHNRRLTSRPAHVREGWVGGTSFMHAPLTVHETHK